MRRPLRFIPGTLLAAVIFLSFSVSMAAVTALKDASSAPASATWNAPTANGWFPNLSSDGRYVAYGNFGDSFVTDLQTKQTWNFNNPPDLTVTHRCKGGDWIEADTVSYICEYGTGLTFYRYEVKVGEWVPKR